MTVFRKIDSYIVVALSDRSLSTSFDSKKDIITDQVAVNAALILDFIQFKIDQQGREDFSALVCYEDIMFDTLIPYNSITKALERLRSYGVITSNRSKSVNGVNSYIINHERLGELEAKGRKIFEDNRKKYKAYREDTVQASINKITENKNKQYWTEEKVQAINDMAYDAITKEDEHNTGLGLTERVIIQVLSKAYFKYSGDKVTWNNLMFNSIRQTIAEASITDYKGKLTEFQSRLMTFGKIQRLIDAVKLMTSNEFKPKDNKPIKFEFRFHDVMISMNNYVSKYHNMQLDHYYTGFDYNQFEDRDYYMGVVDTNNPIEVANPFNNVV